MKRLLLATAFTLATSAALADGFVIGAGRWTCAKAIEVFERGPDIDKGQLAGWIMGFWSSATFQRETGFVDRVEAVGGMKIANATVAECRKAPPDTMIFRVAQSMIRNTK